MFSDLTTSTYPLGLSTEFGRSLLAPGGFFEVAEEEVLGHTHAVFKNRMRSVLEIFANSVAGNGAREYLADEHRRLTYTEAHDAVARTARILREDLGIRPGDRVGLYAANSLEWVVSFWAIVSTGAVVSAMNSYWSDPETQAALELTAPRAILADAKRAAVLDRLGATATTLVLDGDLFTRMTTGPVPDLAPAPTDEDDPVLYMFTSGTTGRPKAVVHRHRTVIGLYQCAIYNALLRMGGIPSEIPAPPRVLVGAPFFHLSALFGSIVMYTAASGLLVLRPGRFEEERVLRAIQDERITYWLSVGSSGPRVAMHPKLADYDLSSIEMVMVGGAPVTPTVRRLLRRAFPGGVDNIRMGYTSTECGTNIATIGGDEFEDDPESAGPIQDGLLVEIRDPAGVPVPDGTDGHVFVRSPFLMLGYLDDPAASAEVLRDGWLSMGDVGRLEKGELYLNSRARDLIFVSSENVYPSEVENRLEEHPDVLETCVAGVDDPITGQAVKAFVVLAPGAVTTVDELAVHCAGGLPAYKVPTHWDLRTEPLPRNATGKILRTALLAEEDASR
jgi:acyl-CoA synthetase (AMP-forming)/AMP-acid ligase II